MYAFKRWKAASCTVSLQYYTETTITGPTGKSVSKSSDAFAEC